MSFGIDSRWLRLAAPVLLGGAALAQVKLNGPLADGPGNNLGRFRLAPDGSRVVYMLNPDTGFELMSVPLDGSAAPVRLDAASGVLFGGGVSTDFRLGADGARVAFKAAEGLFSAPIDGSGGALPLDAPGGFLVLQLDITPDSRRVVFVQRTSPYSSAALFSVPIDASAPAVELGSVAGFLEGILFWIAPDSAHVVFLALGSLYVVPTLGGAAPLFLGNSDGDDVAFTADGQHVVFSSGAGDLLFAPLDGGHAPLSLSSPPYLVIPVDAFQVVPDGRGVVFTAIRDHAGATELFLRPFHAQPRGTAAPSRSVTWPP